VAVGLLAACLFSRRLSRHHLLACLTIWVEPHQLRLHRRHDYDTDLGIGPAAAKESRVFGLTDWLVARFGEDWDTAWRESQDVEVRLFRGFGVAYGALILAHVIVFVLSPNTRSSSGMRTRCDRRDMRAVRSPC
jgi:hypothetical protein